MLVFAVLSCGALILPPVFTCVLRAAELILTAGIGTGAGWLTGPCSIRDVLLACGISPDSSAVSVG